MLKSYGWRPALGDDFEQYEKAGLSPARVIAQHRDRYRLITAEGERLGELSGLFARDAEDGGYPVTGDWVAIHPHADGRGATVEAVAPRSSVFVRRAPGPNGGQQVVAANAEVAMLTSPLNGDRNPRRLERYLAFVRDSGARPVIVLTKADACDDVEARVAEVQAVAGDARVLAISARTGQGLDALSACLDPGTTAVLLGASGAGKSTLVNTLLGVEKMATQAVREKDARGRHTTSHRELILLPSGALILDTPGMRELGLLDADEGMAATFPDVEALVAACKFSDCGHGAEPGCAVRAALEDGELTPDRWANYNKLRQEQASEQVGADPRARAALRRSVVQRTKGLRAELKRKGRMPDQED